MGERLERLLWIGTVYKNSGGLLWRSRRLKAAGWKFWEKSGGGLTLETRQAETRRADQSGLRFAWREARVAPFRVRVRLVSADVEPTLIQRLIHWPPAVSK